MVLSERKSIDDIIKLGNRYHPDRVKFCIDRKRKIVDYKIIDELTKILIKWLY